MTATKKSPPPDQPALLPIEAEAPRPTAQHLIAAWVDGYREVRETEPHPRLMRMVAGQAKALAKDCETIEHWRVAWRACLAAGRAGTVSPAPFLADEQPRSVYAVPGARRSRDMVAEVQQRMKALPR